MGSTAHDAGYSLSTDNSGNVYFGCALNGTVDFDPATGTTLNLTSAGGDDLAIAKYNSSGNLLWAKRLGNSSNNIELDIYADATGNVFLCTSLSGTIDFDPNIGTLNLTSSGGTEMVMAKYNSVGNVQFAKRIGGTSDDYPTGIKTDANGYIYLTGYFRTTVDFDPNAGRECLVHLDTKKRGERLIAWVTKGTQAGRYILHPPGSALIVDAKILAAHPVLYTKPA